MENSFSRLIDMLTAHGVLEKRNKILHFTPTFCSHVALWQAALKSNSIEMWRQVLVTFDKELDAVTDPEVADIMVYLDYYLAKGSTTSDSKMNVSGSK